MRVINVLAAAILMLSSFSFAAPCNVAFSKTPAGQITKKVIAGKTFAFIQSIKNTGSTQLKNLYFQLELPAYFVPVKATAPKYALAGGPGIFVENQYVVFREMRLPARKKLTFRVTIGVKVCQPSGKVQIQGIAYQVDTAGQIVCTNEITPYSINVLPSKKPTGASKWGSMNHLSAWDDNDCTTPTPPPTSTFYMVGVNQFLLGATLVDTRRRLGTAVDQDDQQDRELVSTYTPNQCYQACAFYLGVPAPFYFMLDRVGRCYCCETNRPIYAPGFTTYKAVYLPTKPPTTQPTKVPTQTPTKVPTMIPSGQPTTVPTPAPTPFPTPSPVALSPSPGQMWSQVGSKLVGTGIQAGEARQGFALSLNAKGNVLVVGGPENNNGIGATWFFSGGSDGGWTQTAKLVGTGYALGSSGQILQGNAVSLNAAGTIAAVGGSADADGIGATWVFKFNGANWAQMGGKLVSAVHGGSQGRSVSLNAAGDILAVGLPFNENQLGGALIFTYNGAAWNQASDKLRGSGIVGSNCLQGWSLALNGAGDILAVGGWADKDIAVGGAQVGATWVFKNNGTSWNQVGDKLVGTGYTAGAVQQGYSVALNSAGDRLAVGGPEDAGSLGAAWVFENDGTEWKQMGGKLVGTGATGDALQGSSVSLNAAGDVLVIGGKGDNDNLGSSWVFVYSGGLWSQKDSKLVGTGAVPTEIGYRGVKQGASVDLNAAGNVLVVGGSEDNMSKGATWTFQYGNYFD